MSTTRLTLREGSDAHRAQLAAKAEIAARRTETTDAATTEARVLSYMSQHGHNAQPTDGGWCITFNTSQVG